MSALERSREAGAVRLSEEDVAYFMNLLRNATQPVSTQQLIDALRRQTAPQQTPDGDGAA